MSRKTLFALEAEEGSENPNELLIDKVLKKRETEKEGLSVTADLLRQRQELKKQIDEQLNSGESEDDDKEDDNDSSDEGSEESNSSDEDNKESEESSDKESEGKEEDNSDDSDKEESPEEDDSEAELDAASDPDKLKSMIGSAGKSSSKKETATESFKLPRTYAVRHTLGNIFREIKEAYKGQRVALEGYGLESETPPIDKQPVVYLKNEVSSALNGLVEIAHNFINKNTKTVEGSASAASKLGEQLTVYQEYHKGGKFHFTNEMVSDKDILGVLSVPGKSDLRHTAGILSKYTETVMGLVSKVAKADLKDLGSAFSTSDFKAGDEGTSYEVVLPGFYKVMLSLTHFTNYIETKYEDYQVYRVRYLKTHDLYDLEAITLDKDTEFENLIGKCNSLLGTLALSVDNLKLINESYEKFISEVKAIAYDVEKENRKDLSQLGLDEKMHEFIRFKLMSDLYIINIDSIVEYLSGVLSVLGVVSELTDK